MEFELKFDERGLIPAIVQDYYSKRVLMVAYMNRESLSRSVSEGFTVFYSRSRKALWKKGETSGNVQHIVNIRTDCDRDALLVEVIADGPACHTGEESCFFNKIFESGLVNDFSLQKLYALIKGRKDSPESGSYTTYLFEKGIDKILKKLGEESTEVVIAGKGGDRAETVYELSDLLYHAMVLMVEMGIEPKEVFAELARRHVVDHKTKQEKMGGEDQN